MERCVRTFIFAIALACGAASAQTLPDQFTVEGRLYSSGVALSGNVDIKFEVIDSSNTSCVLYREVHSGIDLGSVAATQGIFALKLGAGTQLFHPARLSAVFANGVLQTGDNNGSNTSNCSFTPTAASQRLVKMYVSQDSGTSWTYLGPDTAITTSPTAMVAETLQGRGLTDFIMADSAVAHMNQTDIATIFNSTNYTKLTSLLAGSSTQYMPGSPTASVSFNNQRITNLADPTTATDAATKSYADANIGGKTADTSNVSASSGDGYVLAWDKTAGKWKAVAPGDSTKLALAGGTMSGTINFDAGVGTGINLNGNDLLATGHITISPLKTLTLGKLTDAQETALVSTLTAANAGASWYNSSGNVLKYWNGTAASAPVMTVNGKSGSTITLNANDLGLGSASLENVGTTAGDVPQLDATGKIPMALLPATKYSDLTNGAGAFMNYMPGGTACTTNQTLKWDDPTQRWICANDNDSFSGSTAGGDLTGTYPNPVISPLAVTNTKIADGAISTPKLFANPGVNRLVATDSSTGAALKSLDCATNNEILQWNSATGWQCASVSTALGSSYIVDGGNSRGFTLSIGTNDNADLNFETVGAPRMTITTGGNVGIGTTAPAKTLDVNGTANFAGTVYLSPGTTSNPGFAFANSTNTGIYSTSTGVLDIEAGGTHVLGMSNSGITADKQLTAQVSTVNTYASTSSSSFYPGTGFNSSFVALNGAFGDNNAVLLGFSGYNGSGKNQNAYFGISTTPGSTIYNPAIVLGQQTGATSYAERMRIDSNGNVGIGTTNPAAVLDVSGAIRMKPTTLPSTVSAGTLAFDNSNAFKYYDGTTWNTVVTDVNSIFAQKGANSDITSMSAVTNISAGGPLTIAQGTATSLTLGNTGASSSTTVNGGTGGLNLLSSGSGASAISLSAPVGSITMSQGTTGSLTLGNNSSTGNVTLQGSGSISLNSNSGNTGAVSLMAANGSAGTSVTITSAGTGSNAISLTSSGGIKLAAGTNKNITMIGMLDLSSNHSAVILPRGLTSEQPSGASNGMIRYNTDTDKFEGFEAGGWKDLIPSGGTGDFMKDGSVAMTGAFQALSGTANNPGISFSSDVNSGLFSAGTGALGLSTSGQERVRIDSSGKVGIGTNSPAAILDLRTSSTSGYVQTIDVPLGYAGNMFQISKAGSQVVTINSNGQVFAGGGSLSAPGYSFTTNTSSGMFSGGMNELAFATNSLERLRIDSSGKVGIGLTTPSTALDVNGDVRARHLAGAPSTSYAIVASGAGTASLGSANTTAANFSVNGNDVTFKVQFDKGGTAGSGPIVVVRFKNAYSSVPVCIAGAGDSNASQVPVFITPTTSDFTISAPGSLGFAGTYTWFVHCLQ